MPTATKKISREQAFRSAYAAKRAVDQKGFISNAKKVVFYFFKVTDQKSLQSKFKKGGIRVDLNTAQDWCNIIESLWMAVSCSHVDRHAVERLIERMAQERLYSSWDIRVSDQVSHLMGEIIFNV